MVKIKELSDDLRWCIINSHSDGNGYKKISKFFHFPVPTIQKIKHGVAGNIGKCGRNKIITPRLSRRLIRNISTEPLSTVRDLKENLVSRGTDVSERSIRRELHSCGFNGRRPRKTSLLRKKIKLNISNFLMTIFKNLVHGGSIMLWGCFSSNGTGGWLR